MVYVYDVFFFNFGCIFGVKIWDVCGVGFVDVLDGICGNGGVDVGRVIERIEDDDVVIVEGFFDGDRYVFFFGCNYVCVVGLM